jgi:hypothetical protein
LSPSLPPLIVATLAVVRVLDGLGIRYLVGGSLASSAYGEARTTQDVDIVVDLVEAQVDPFVERLGSDYYADDERARQAVARRASFNVIHLPTMSKIDIFVAGDDAASRRQLKRRRTIVLPGLPEVALSVASPEDVIVQKLRWYRLGNEVSERQWRDALGVLRVQGGALDHGYLRGAARDLEVEDLLERLLSRS